MEVNKMLAEMEKIVANNLRLKTEMGVDSSHFWKATGKRFSRINERMIRIANTQLELAIAKKNTEEQYNAQYLVNEYEGMLEETKEFYNVK